MQPTNDQLADASIEPLNPIANVKQMLGMIKQQAEMQDDGNTVALVNKIARDVGNINIDYQTVDFDRLTEYLRSKEQPVSEQDPLFVAQSYEDTASKDVNQAPFPKTDENAGAPFQSKGKVTKVEDVDGSKQDTSKKPGTKAE